MPLGLPQLRVVAAAVLVAATAVVVVAPTAHAATARNGVCEDGEFCLYYNSGNAGSLTDFADSVSTYGTGSTCITYVGPGNGKGQCVKNNAASVWNRKSAEVTLFYESGYAGALQSFAPGAKTDIDATLKNENAGHRVGSSSRTNLSTALYQASARITAGFDGYLSTPGRHEGIDISRSLGAKVYALTSGTITYVAQGFRGGSGLSTIAVYNSDFDKTVIYLHSNPLDSLAAGQHVDRGQYLAVQDYRGVSSSSASHTHVEMRPGRQTHASKSVDDPVLDNPNPTTFWEARGYNICCS